MMNKTCTRLLRLAAIVALLLNAACASTNAEDDAFAHADYSGGSAKYGVYVPAQGRSIISGLTF